MEKTKDREEKKVIKTEQNSPDLRDNHQNQQGEGVKGDLPQEPKQRGRINLNRRLSERQSKEGGEGKWRSSPRRSRERKKEVNSLLPQGFEEKVLKIARVVKVVKGGRRFSFSAYVAVGNRRGRIGLGHGKANEVQDAVKKAIKDALKKSFLVPIVRTSVPHEITHKFLATKILIKPAKQGRGLVAAGTVRSLVELAGFTNITTKVYGSRTVQNVAMGFLQALAQIRSAGEIRRFRSGAAPRRN